MEASHLSAAAAESGAVKTGSKTDINSADSSKRGMEAFRSPGVVRLAALGLVFLAVGVAIGAGVGTVLPVHGAGPRIKGRSGGAGYGRQERQLQLQLPGADDVDCTPCPQNGSSCPACEAFPTRQDLPGDCQPAEQCFNPLNVGTLSPGEEPKSHSVFRLLAPEEISAVARFMTTNFSYVLSGSKWGELLPPENMTAAAMPILPKEDILIRVEGLLPPKRDVLAFLDEDGPLPPRYAKAIVVRGSELDVMEYKVGPVPFDLETGPEEVTEMRQPGEIHWAKRPLFAEQTAWVEYAAAQAAWDLKELFRNFTGGKCYPIPSLAAEFAGQGPISEEECEGGWVDWISTPNYQADPTKRQSVFYWQFFPLRESGSQGDLHSIPITFKVDESDLDHLKWRAFDFEYCLQGPFPTAEALMKAWQDGELESCGSPGWEKPDYDNTWATTDRPRMPMPDAFVPGPRMYEPGFKRFYVIGAKVATGSRFRWMNWEAHFRLDPQHGMQVFDIQWEGERIVYELALQDQYVAYSGYNGNGMMLFMDSAFNLGDAALPLEVGVDCPETATYFSTVRQYTPDGAGTERDVMCMFEDDLGGSAWRHSHPNGPTGPQVDGLRATALVLRSISTIGNYDYIYDIVFHLDGTIEVRVHMAGYMECVYSGPGTTTVLNTPFGAQVKENTFALLHDHLSNWKVDLDVHGPINSFRQDVVRCGSFQEALKDVAPGEGAPGWFSNAELPLKYIERTTPQQESAFMVNVSEPALWRFVSEDVTDAWGNVAGYAISTGDVSPQLLPPDHPVTKAGAWTKYHLAVTQHKDEEPNSILAFYDFYNPGAPLASLDQFLDGESIQGQDLVAWVTTGVQHIPRTEDVPLIQNFGTSFYLKPWNYFSELPSLKPADTEAFEATCVPQIGLDYLYGWYFGQTAG